MHSLQPAPALGSVVSGARLGAGAPLGGGMQWKHSEVLGAGGEKCLRVLQCCLSLACTGAWEEGEVSALLSCSIPRREAPSLLQPGSFWVLSSVCLRGWHCLFHAALTPGGSCSPWNAQTNHCPWSVCSCLTPASQTMGMDSIPRAGYLWNWLGCLGSGASRVVLAFREQRVWKTIQGPGVALGPKQAGRSEG